MADFDFSTLVTDRSASDLELLRDLLSTPLSEWTAEQLAQFNQAISKGAYNYTDLNRVTACMEYLDEVLRAYGYRTGYQRIIVPHTGGGGSALPEGYTELEYIESAGTQYIDTGFQPNQDTRVIMDVQATQDETVAYFGARGSSSTNAFIVWELDSSQARSDYGSKRTPFSVSTLARVTIDKNKNSVSINDSSLTQTEATFTTGYNMLLLCQNTAGEVDSRKMSALLYSCQIYDNDVLIRDYVPCQGPSGDIGLYDTENNQFYGNAGTGTFTAGPEIPPEPGEVLDPYTWYESDTPTASQMSRYLQNVSALRETLTLPAGTDEVPEDMNGLKQAEANNIEIILGEIRAWLENMTQAWFYSGDLYAGEV